MKSKTNRPPDIGEEIIEGLTAFRDHVRSGADLEKRFVIHKVTLHLEPQEYTPADIRQLRENIHASQAVFAQVVGVSPSTIRSWEQGTRIPPRMARRLLDEINDDRKKWIRRLQKALV